MNKRTDIACLTILSLSLTVAFSGCKDIYDNLGDNNHNRIGGNRPQEAIAIDYDSTDFMSVSDYECSAFDSNEGQHKPTIVRTIIEDLLSEFYKPFNIFSQKLISKNLYYFSDSIIKKHYKQSDKVLYYNSVLKLFISTVKHQTYNCFFSPFKKKSYKYTYITRAGPAI